MTASTRSATYRSCVFSDTSTSTGLAAPLLMKDELNVAKQQVATEAAAAASLRKQVEALASDKNAALEQLSAQRAKVSAGAPYCETLSLTPWSLSDGSDRGRGERREGADGDA